MAIRNNSPVLVILWPNGDVEVTQVIGLETELRMAKIPYHVVTVQSNTPESVEGLRNAKILATTKSF
jgi:hypothetical protein